MSDVRYASVLELAAMVQDGEVTPVELVSGALERIERLDPHVNAFIDVDGERALRDAAGVKPGNGSPFAGVPIAIKNNVPVADRPLTMASALLDGYRAQHDAYLVRRLRAAGFVIVGLTNLPEFGILPTTEPRHTGVTRNPWDLSRTPGGSSGGSGAAVAAGMVPVAHGNDGGGSLRIPAACCGLVGCKPSRGRISRGPDLGDSFLGVEGVLTRDVADTAALLDVLAGYEAGDSTWAPRPEEAFAVAAQRDPARLRIAVTTRNYQDAPVHPDLERALRDTADALADLGHEVVEASPPMPAPEVLDLFISVFGPQISLGVLFAQSVAGRSAADHELEPLTRAVFACANAVPSHGYLAAVARLQAMARTVVGFFADFDVLLTPTLAVPPLPIGELHGCGTDPMEDLRRSGSFAPFTALFNVTGQPALTIPAGLMPDGLPASVQLVGRPLGESVLLQLASQLERTQPWGGLRPATPEMGEERMT